MSIRFLCLLLVFVLGNVQGKGNEHNKVLHRLIGSFHQDTLGLQVATKDGEHKTTIVIDGRPLPSNLTTIVSVLDSLRRESNHTKKTNSSIQPNYDHVSSEHTKGKLNRRTGSTPPLEPPPHNTTKDNKCPTEASFKSIPDSEIKNFILSDQVLPESYTIAVAIDPQRDIFMGEVEISVSMTTPQTRIVLHAHPELVISSAILAIESAGKVFTPQIMRNSKNSILVLDWADDTDVVALNTRSILVLISFCSLVDTNGEMKGVYASSFLNAKGEQNKIISTQFEPNDARRAFPCFDEPNFKATFEISIAVPNDPTLTVLSNMPEKIGRQGKHHEHREPLFPRLTSIMMNYYFHKSYKIISFEKSPLMSSYLVAWAIGHFSMIQGKANAGINGVIPIRCFGEEKYKNQMGLALSSAIASLEYFTKFYGVPYALPKMDLVAIPNFSFGAMENWGLVTYRRESFYFDPENLSEREKARIALVVWHENAHQWFGNLVTMKNWNELYLNEGFATYMESYYGAWLFKGKFPVWEDFSISTIEVAKSVDSLQNSNAIEDATSSGQASEEMFDSISYEKGASLLFMLRTYLSVHHKDSFETGVKSYIKSFQYKNTVSKDLWDHLSHASGIDVENLMNKWTKEPGYPIIMVSLNKEKCEISLTQEKYQFSLAKKSNQEKNTKKKIWDIPLLLHSHFTGKDLTQLLMFKTEKDTISCSEIGFHNKESTKCCFENEDFWIKFNWRQSGYVRVHYDNHLLNQILKSFNSFPENDKTGLLLDLFATNHFSAELTPISHILRLVKKTSEESELNCLVWSSIIPRMMWIHDVVRKESFHSQYKAFIQKIITNLLNKVGFSPQLNEKVQINILREELIAWAVHLNDDHVIKTLSTQFINEEKKKEKSQPYCRTSMYVAAVLSKASEDIIDWMLSESEKDEPFRSVACLHAASQTKNVDDFDRILNFALQKVRTADFFIVIRNLLKNKVTSSLMWSFINDHYDKIVEKMGDNVRELFQVFEQFSTEDELETVKNFFTTRASSSLDKTKKQTIEKISLKIDWVRENKEDLQNFLENHSN
eukprot:c21120_g1_i1.p1 GENE.c21120_g1_i1~~c21120_g1_i1.p1  ORF type:complete len:1060 (+),score=416.77 c21120_g1_i1:84-3263(+)